MAQPAKHYAVIDMIKGMTILLVVAGHSGLPAEVNSILSAVRMPLFFIVSGYVFSSTKYFGRLHALLAARSTSIVVPYVTAGLLFYAFWALRQFADNSWKMAWHEPLLSVFYGTYNAGLLEVNVSLWFLPALLMAQVIFCLVMGAVRRKSLIVQTLVFLAIAISGGLAGMMAALPWGVDIGLFAQLFLFAGFKMKEAGLLERIKPIGWQSAALAVIFAAAVYYNGPVNMGLREYNHIWLYLVGGLSGGCLLIQLIRLLEKRRALVQGLTRVGRESLAILIYHGFFLTVIQLAESRLFSFDLPWFVVFMIAVGGSIGVSALVKKIAILHFLLQGANWSRLSLRIPPNKQKIQEVHSK